jgi:hypothetical protein
MELRNLVTQCVMASLAVGFILSGLMLLTNHQREALGMLFGTAIGVTNQIMLAIRVAGIGEYGSARQTQAIIMANTGMRFLMIGLATYITIRLSATFSLLGFTAGLLVTMAVTTVVGARRYMRDD